MDVKSLVGWREFKTEFRGNPVSVEVRPLKTAEMVTLSPYMTDGGKISGTKAFQIQVDVLPIFTDAVKNVKGLESDGVPIESRVICEEVVFMELAWKIIRHLFSISSLGGDEEKNSDGHSGTSTSKEK